jgi:hypothetical protein
MIELKDSTRRDAHLLLGSAFLGTESLPDARHAADMTIRLPVRISHVG